jgi:hypothetical protein
MHSAVLPTQNDGIGSRELFAGGRGGRLDAMGNIVTKIPSPH